jgi:hypothetical protein
VPPGRIAIERPCDSEGSFWYLIAAFTNGTLCDGTLHKIISLAGLAKKRAK